jgi:hypothetical protein
VWDRREVRVVWGLVVAWDEVDVDVGDWLGAVIAWGWDGMLVRGFLWREKERKGLERDGALRLLLTML